MVYPLISTQNQKPSENESGNISKTTADGKAPSNGPIWVEGIVPPLTPGVTNGGEGGFVEVKRPEGRKKRSGVCIGIWLAVGALCAIILILMAYMAANYLENQSRDKWVKVDCGSHEEYCHYSREDHEGKNDGHNCDLRGGHRPYQEPGFEILEHMFLSSDHIWQTMVPNCGHDEDGMTMYNYSFVVDFEKEVVAIRTGATSADSTNSGGSCFVAHTGDILDFPEESVVAQFLENGNSQSPEGSEGNEEMFLQSVLMEVTGLKQHFFDATPFTPQLVGQVGEEVESLCRGATMYSLENIDAEIEENLQDLLEFAHDTMDEAGELLGAVQESLSDLSLSDASSVNALMQDMAELLLFIPTVAEGVPDPFRPQMPGGALSLNIRTHHLEMQYEEVWPRLDDENANRRIK